MRALSITRGGDDMSIYCEPGTWPLPRVEKDDGSIEHVCCDGSREHVLYWTSQGRFCTEERCEINKAATARSFSEIAEDLLESRHSLWEKLAGV